MMQRRNAGKGRGRGYKNLPMFPKDPKVHSDSAKGRRQPQRIIDIYTLMPIGEIVRDLSNFKDFSETKDFKRFLESNKRVIKFNHTYIKKITPKGRDEVKVQNIVSERFRYYPKAVERSVDGREFLITHEVEGDSLYKPISMLNPQQKSELAGVTNYLFEKGYIDFDLRKDNIVIDRMKRPVVIDFNNVKKIKDRHNLEVQYNLNILSIYGLLDRRAKRYMTMNLRQLGLTR